MRIAIGLGSSLGDRRRTLEQAVCQLSRFPRTRFVRGSRWYRSPPLRGGTAQNWFLNGVIVLDTQLTVEELLQRCQDLEQAAGRRRARFWGDRSLDLDLLLADGIVRDGPKLRLPHPAVADRPFVLEPLLDAWPGAKHPLTGTPWQRGSASNGVRAWPIGIQARPILRLSPDSSCVP